MIRGNQGTTPSLLKSLPIDTVLTPDPAPVLRVGIITAPLQKLGGEGVLAASCQPAVQGFVAEEIMDDFGSGEQLSTGLATRLMPPYNPRYKCGSTLVADARVSEQQPVQVQTHSRNGAWRSLRCNKVSSTPKEIKSPSKSKLSLLDDQNLTSFPIPPPRKSPTRNNEYLSNSVSMRVHAHDRRISLEPAVKDVDNINELVLIEDYVSSASDMAPNCTSGFLNTAPRRCDIRATKKKMSLSDLKSRINKSNHTGRVPLRLKNSRQLSLHSSLTLTPRVVNDSDVAYREETPTEFFRDEFTGYQLHNKQLAHRKCGSEDGSAPLRSSPDVIDDQTTNSTSVTAVSSNVDKILLDILKPAELSSCVSDKYLSDLNITSQLRYCVICEKPLYELSALIPPDKNFREILCQDCTEKYEKASKILEDYEFETTVESIDDFMDSSMESGLGDEPRVIVANHNDKFVTKKFSHQLLNRLYLQSNNVSATTESPTLSNFRKGINMGKSLDASTRAWFYAAKNKLRWRWRASGLLPWFLTSSR
ncbi:HBR179Cp [Eremothecium sinecaudum]|uniref:HBR179Cp n=1 Tax=Eremothecium sinecaudum TaxID=45286 RepID=A0A120K174_9SACH|nr:HBR179Cp [Eremothecium sinecaudum]AMD19080.1 HBR179Cp [Eremothecium sinecaudum]